MNSRSILYVSTPWPYRSIRSLHVARALRHVGDVSLLVVKSEGTDSGTLPELAGEFPVVAELEVASMRSANLGAKLSRLIDPRCAYPHGIGIENNLRLDALVSEITRFDLSWIFKFRNANMFGHRSWPQSVLDVDDLPSGVYKTAYTNGTSVRAKLASALQVGMWRRRERLLGERFDVLAVCSDADRRQLKASNPIHVIPNGFERPTDDPSYQPASPPSLGFIGLFNYEPNVAGVRWFTEYCWPSIKRAIPDVRLRLVGRGTDGPMKPAGQDIDGLGWVDDATGEIATWSAMIVPLHVGGGTRVKIPEGFSRKCPIVSTSVGAFGYEVTDKEHLRLADTPEEFATACIDLIRNPAEGERLAERAWADFLTNWTWDAIAPRVWAAAEDCLRRNQDQHVSGAPRRLSRL